LLKIIGTEQDLPLIIVRIEFIAKFLNNSNIDWNDIQKELFDLSVLDKNICLSNMQKKQIFEYKTMRDDLGKDQQAVETYCYLNEIVKTKEDKDNFFVSIKNSAKYEDVHFLDITEKNYELIKNNFDIVKWILFEKEIFNKARIYRLLKK
jgi:hypothetical protein